MRCANVCFLFFNAFMSKACSSALAVSIYIALLLFGQVFLSTLAHASGIDNRFLMLLFRGAIGFYSACVILWIFYTKKTKFFEAFPLALTSFWFFYFALLLRDHFFLGIVTVLPIWEFFAWGIGGCFLPSLACYFLTCNSERGQYLTTILPLGFLLLGSSSLFFIFSESISAQRFELPSLNPINASHSFFILSLLSISSLVQRNCAAIKSLAAAVVCAFGISMGIYAGSRGAMLAFVCSFIIIFLMSNINKLWVLMPLLFSGFLLVQFDPTDLVGRLGTAGSDLNSILRWSAIEESIRVFLAHPFVGAGFGYHSNLSDSLGYPQMWYPHNFIFESLALGGLVLTIPLVTCIYLSVRSCRGFRSDYSVSDLWRLAILVQAFGYVTFSGHLANVPMFWIALGLSSSFSPFRFTKVRH